MRRVVLLLLALLAAVGWAGPAGAAESATLRVISKPSDNVAEHTSQAQVAVPAGAREIPFEETAPEPVFTDSEKQRGYVLFQRPTMDPVYPNTRPLAEERLESLVAFAAPGQFEPVTFSVYPSRPLKNLKVRASALISAAGQIPAAQIDVRLVTYWNVGYPSYQTIKTYRRTPELLERVTVHSSPANECQRYWITVHVPEDAKAGLYTGSVTLWDEGFESAVQIPMTVRVLGFKLQKDPNKHFSAYFSTRNTDLYKGRDEAFIRKAADNDYRAMVDFGLDMIPTFSTKCGDNDKILLVNEGELDHMAAAGLRGPVPVSCDNFIGHLYKDMTPNGKHGTHWQVDPMPPETIYPRITELLKAFEVERKAKHWPEFIYCPIDEVHHSYKEFGSKVYAAVKAAGVRTYATKDPQEADAAVYAPYLDIWCSQPFSVPYEQIMAQKRYEYWSYPNHIAGEIKDRLTMCKGGRMTYGFGFWRSGYTTLIPWDWSWCAGGPTPFDYLGGFESGCGQRVDDDGEVIPAIYWACFREGNDDCRYLYTLEQAIVERESSKDPACMKAVAEGRRRLQETWDGIHVQQKYLADDMWPSEEFNAIRWSLAEEIGRLLKFPAVTHAVAPSVVLESAAKAAGTEPASASEAVDSNEKLVSHDLGGDFKDWINGTKEGSVQTPEAARRQPETPALRWTVVVDYLKDGENEGGKYPIGWPRISRLFKPGELDMTPWETLTFWIRVDSDRNDFAAQSTPINLVVFSHKSKAAIFHATVDVGGKKNTWQPVRFSISKMMAKSSAGKNAWASISQVQLFISEEDFADKTKLVFDIGQAAMTRRTEPTITGTDAPHNVLLPRDKLAFDFDVLGTTGVTPSSHTVVAALETAEGKVQAQSSQDLAGPHRIVLPLAGLAASVFKLHLSIRDGSGKTCCEWTQPLTTYAGPTQ